MEENFAALEGAEAVIICRNKGEPTPFTDNQETACVVCGQPLICRNYVDLNAMRPICYKHGMMAMTANKDPIENIRAHPLAQDEFDAVFGDGMTDKAIENAKLAVLLAKAFSGTDALDAGSTFETEDSFVCAVCGQTYGKGRSDEEAMAELREKFPDVQPDECAPVCGSCNDRLEAWFKEQGL